ncbi:MAG: N,N-dimethylformamidase beta subunit family domain-containing protein, partial [Methylococcales bacterium]
MENLKQGAQNWRHKDILSADYIEKEAKGKINKILPEVHDVSTYCAPENAASNPFAKDDCIAAYTDLPSVNVGQSIKFKVSVNPAPQTFKIEFYRMGWYGGAGVSAALQSADQIAGIKQPDCPMAVNTGETECNWSESYTLNVPTTWTTGVYTAILTNETGYKTEVLFVVRDDNRVADFLYSVPVLTYAAYNNYPSWSATTSKSLYDGGSTGANTVVGGIRAAKSSLERPQHHQFGGWLGSDWTEIHLVAWLEKMGYNIKYITDVDLDAMNKTDLLNYKGLIFGGHSEYWTKKMLDNVESARDSGVNLAFFGANAAHWQVRLENSSKGKAARSVVGYKDTATTNIDPITDPARKTKQWRDLGRPEQTLVGVQYPAGGWKLPTTEQPPLIVQNSASWV